MARSGGAPLARGAGTAARAPFGRAAFVGLVMLLPALFIPVPLAHADSTTVMGAMLPSGRDGTSAIWDGSNAYVFGGLLPGNVATNQIVRYEPSTDTTTVMSATLPSGRWATSAVWTGTYAYIFGGFIGGGESTAQIVRYEPSTDTATPMGATLPSPRGVTSAVWTGTYAYVFGGYVTGADYTAQILRFDPSADTVSTMGAVLPAARSATSAVWDGSRAYVFGGEFGGTTRQIVRYDPSTDAATVMGATFPSYRSRTSAAWDGTQAYIFGGMDGNGQHTGEIDRYVPASDAFVLMASSLPSPRESTSAVWAGSRPYVFGGYNSTVGLLRHVVRYDLSAPGPPQSPAASAGPGLGEVSLGWQPPPANSYSSALTGYKVYRGTASGGETFLTQLGVVTTYADQGLADGTTYYYKVSAVNAIGEGNESSEVSATTFAPPGMPTNFLAKPSTMDLRDIDLTWQAPASDGGTPITGYRIYRSDTTGGAGSYTLLAVVGTVPAYTDQDVPLGDWYYKVAAVNLAGEGPTAGPAPGVGLTASLSAMPG